MFFVVVDVNFFRKKKPRTNESSPDRTYLETRQQKVKQLFNVFGDVSKIVAISIYSLDARPSRLGARPRLQILEQRPLATLVSKEQSVTKQPVTPCSTYRHEASRGRKHARPTRVRSLVAILRSSVSLCLWSAQSTKARRMRGAAQKSTDVRSHITTHVKKSTQIHWPTMRLQPVPRTPPRFVNCGQGFQNATLFN